MLGSLGHDAHGVMDGLAALGLVMIARPDIVLVDIMMPKMDGCEVIARLRNVHPTLGIIAMSAGELDMLVRLQAFGVREFMTKPIAIPDLSRAIDRALVRAA